MFTASCRQDEWLAKTLILFFILLLSAAVYPLSASYAAPCYGTRFPNKGKLNIGAQAHIIKNRELKKDFGKVSSQQYFYQMSYGIFHWLSIDGKIGIGDVTYRPQGSAKINYPSSFAGGYGFRVKPYKNDQERIEAVFGFQHISVHPYSKQVNSVTNTVILDDWQVSALVSKGISRFTPYAGARLTRVDLIHRIKNQGRERKESDVEICPVIGTDFNINESSFLTFEASFVKEVSFSAGITYNF